MKYGVFTLTLAILTATSAIEYVIVKKSPGTYSNAQDEKMDTKIREIFYRNSATWALRGLVITIVLLAIYDYIPLFKTEEEIFLGIPFTFICIWAYYYMMGSVSINVRKSIKEYDKELNLFILAHLRENSAGLKTTRFADLSVYVQGHFHFPNTHRFSKKILNSLGLIHPSVKMIMPLWNDLEITPARIRDLTIILCDKRYLENTNYDDLLIHEIDYYRWLRNNRE